MNRTHLALVSAFVLTLAPGAPVGARAQAPVAQSAQQDTTVAPPPPAELRRMQAVGQMVVSRLCPSGPQDLFVFDTRGAGTVIKAHPLVSVATTAPGPGFSRTVLNVNMGRCKEVSVVVEYEGAPTGWTVDFGDSQTNNGYGGGAGGTTLSDAELQVAAGTVSVYRAGPGNLIQSWPVTLQDGALKVVARNQFLSWGQPYTVVPNPGGSALFALPDITGPQPDGNRLYLGINRVIYGPGNRVGTGVRRVYVSFR